MNRIGLVGFNTESGLGVVNRQIAKHLPVTSWLVREHRRFPTLDFSLLGSDSNVYAEPGGFLRKGPGTILFAEDPLWPDLPQRAREQGKRVACVPMQEWFPPFDHPLWDWPQYVDLFICPTLHCYNELRDRYPCIYIPWPVDIGHWEYRQRRVCQRFVFANGHGGWHGRKGGDVVRKAKELWPEMPLVVFSQTEDEWPSGTDYRGRADDPKDMYAAGDVLLCPHSCDGIGLEIGEALASGMPVVTPTGRPWNEYPSVSQVIATVERRKIRREIEWYIVEGSDLAAACRGLLGRDITQASSEARFWAQDHSWDRWKDAFLDLVLG